MNTTRNIVSVLVCTCFVLGMSFAQQNDMVKAKEIILKTKSFYETHQRYSATVSYVLYEEYTGDATIEAYEGVFAKRGKDVYSKIHQTETLLVTEGMIKVNHLEKAMLYAKNQGAIDPSKQLLQLDALFQNFENASVIENQNAIQITLTTPPVTGILYGKVILKVRKKDFALEKQTLFLLRQFPVKQKDGTEKLTNPRLEIGFSDIQLNIEKYKNKFDLSNYIIKDKQSIKAAMPFVNYQFLDTTK